MDTEARKHLLKTFGECRFAAEEHSGAEAAVREEIADLEKRLASSRRALGVIAEQRIAWEQAARLLARAAQDFDN